MRRKVVIMMNRLYMVELNKLMLGLMERSIEFNFTPFMNGGKIEVADGSWDAICHDGSYGHNDGLLEVMGSIVEIDYDTVEGFLTANQILNRLDEAELRRC